MPGCLLVVRRHFVIWLLRRQPGVVGAPLDVPMPGQGEGEDPMGRQAQLFRHQVVRSHGHQGVDEVDSVAPLDDDAQLPRLLEGIGVQVEFGEHRGVFRTLHPAGGHDTEHRRVGSGKVVNTEP